MRPEAWLLSGLYWLWCVVARHAGRERVTLRGRSPALAPLIWVALDLVVDRRPAVLADHTSGLAEELGRTSGGLSDVSQRDA